MKSLKAQNEDTTTTPEGEQSLDEKTVGQRLDETLENFRELRDSVDDQLNKRTREFNTIITAAIAAIITLIIAFELVNRNSFGASLFLNLATELGGAAFLVWLGVRLSSLTSGEDRRFRELQIELQDNLNRQMELIRQDITTIKTEQKTLNHLSLEDNSSTKFEAEEKLSE